MCILFCAIYTQTMLRKKNIAKKEGYSCAQNIADYLRIVLDYCLLGIAQEADLLIANTHFRKRNGNMDIHNLF